MSLGYVESPGTLKEELDTPALLLDLDAVEDNIEKMAAFLSGWPRPVATPREDP